MRKDHAKIFVPGVRLPTVTSNYSRASRNKRWKMPRPRHRHARHSGLGSKELVGSDQEGGGLKLFSIPFFVPGFR